MVQDGSVELATSSDEDDAANPPTDSLTAGNADANSGAARPPTHRKRYRVDEPNDDPDQATSARVRHSDHQHPVASTAPASTPSAADSCKPMLEAGAAAVLGKPQAKPVTHVVAHAAHRVAPSSAAAGQFAYNTSTQQGRATSSALRPPAIGSGPTVSASSQQGDCIGPDGTFVGRAAAAGLPPNIMQQTRAALGLWEQLHETASTPSTVLAPVNRHGPAVRTVSVGTDNSAA